MWWKAKIETSKASANVTLVGLWIKKSGDKFTVRMNFADGSFTDVDFDRVPRFDLGEEVTVSLSGNCEVPTRETTPAGN